MFLSDKMSAQEEAAFTSTLCLSFEAALPERRTAVLVVRSHFDPVTSSHLQIRLAEAFEQETSFPL